VGRPAATIVVPTYNEAHHLDACVRSVLKQTRTDWELIVVDDASSDGTAEVVGCFDDPRIRYLRNAANLGPPASRNVGVLAASTEFIFFLDADCQAAENWLEQGLELFEERGLAGIEGRLIYVAPDYRPAYSDRIVQNLTGGFYMTANMAYRREALLKVGLFNPELRRYEDRDLALRVKNSGAIVFAPQMVVTHAHVKWTPRAYLRSAQAACYTVTMYKRNKSDQAAHRIYYGIYRPKELLAIVFPPLVLTELFAEQFRTFDDFLVLAMVYPRMVYERVLLWQASIRERTLLI
jgi:glycosyltransferase involved in cell wall biosynthesis